MLFMCDSGPPPGKPAICVIDCDKHVNGGALYVHPVPSTFSSGLVIDFALGLAFIQMSTVLSIHCYTVNT